jgi:epsilon-lactone hydrolase
MASIQSAILKFWLKRLNVFGAKEYDPHKLRANYERLSGWFIPRRDVQIMNTDAGGVPSEWLVPRDAPQDSALMYIHGGAWFMGSAGTHRSLVSNLAYAGKMRALSLNYRLTPEHPFPAGLEDCIAAYQWLLQNGIAPRKIIVAGDSAGGNLTLALLVALRDAGNPLPAGAVALSPATDLAHTGASHKTRLGLDPFFSNMGPNTIIEDYVGGQDIRHPLISPLYADLAGLPPLLLHVGDYETMLDDSVLFGERAVASGVDARTVVWPQMFHVFQMFSPILPEARQAVDQIGAFIRSRVNSR